MLCCLPATNLVSYWFGLLANHRILQKVPCDVSDRLLSGKRCLDPKNQSTQTKNPTWHDAMYLVRVLVAASRALLSITTMDISKPIFTNANGYQHQYLVEKFQSLLDLLQIAQRP